MILTNCGRLTDRQLSARTKTKDKKKKKKKKKRVDGK